MLNVLSPTDRIYITTSVIRLLKMQKRFLDNESIVHSSGEKEVCFWIDTYFISNNPGMTMTQRNESYSDKSFLKIPKKVFTKTFT